MTDIEPPFVVVAERAGRAIPIASEAYRLVMFESSANALAFAEAFVAVGFDSATVATGSDEKIAAVLDQHEAEWPLTFEIELAPDLDENEQRQAAYEYGAALAVQWRRGMDSSSPN
jgi:hypothetical protein